MNLSKTVFATAIFTAISVSSPALSDERQMIDIPLSSQTALLKEMRSLVDNLDEVLLALSDGDFAEVSRIADFKLGFGHARWQKLLKGGMSPDDVQTQVNKMRKNRASGSGGQGHGGGGGMFGQGVGRLLPQEVRPWASRCTSLPVRFQSQPKKPEQTLQLKITKLLLVVFRK